MLVVRKGDNLGMVRHVVVTKHQRAIRSLIMVGVAGFDAGISLNAQFLHYLEL
jgi:hypothetical protein